MQVIFVLGFVYTLVSLKFNFSKSCLQVCKNVKCAEVSIKNCTDGYIIPKQTDCNCCDRCQEYAELGETCYSENGNIIQCEDDLICSPDTKKCEDDCTDVECLFLRCAMKLGDCDAGTTKRFFGYCNCCSICIEDLSVLDRLVMTPDQWRVIFYLQVLKSYKDVLRVDDKLRKELLRAQIAEIRSQSSTEGPLSSEKEEVEVEEILESLPQTIEEIDVTIEKLTHELEVIEIDESSSVEEPVFKVSSRLRITYEPIEPLQIVEFDLPQFVFPIPMLDLPSTPKSSPLGIFSRKQFSSEQASLKISDESIADVYSIPEVVEEPIVEEEKEYKPPPQMFPEIWITDNKVEVFGLDIIRLRCPTPTLPKIDEHCQTNILYRPISPYKKPTVPKGEAEIFARSTRRVMPTPRRFSALKPAECKLEFKQLIVERPPIQIEPYPNISLVEHQPNNTKSSSINRIPVEKIRTSNLMRKPKSIINN